MTDERSGRVRWTALAISLIAMLLGAGCSSMRSGAHQHPEATLDNYVTFAWIAEDPWIPTGPSSAELSPLVRRMLKDELRKAFEQRGYRYEPDRARADFVIAYTVGTREMIEMTSYPAIYRSDWEWFPHSPRYPHDGFRQHSYTEGTLGIDVFDRATRQPVWHGWASKRIVNSDRDDPAPTIDAAVNAIARRFPQCTADT